MTTTYLPTCLDDTDQEWFSRAIQRPLNKNDLHVIAFYLNRNLSLKEIARLFIEAQSR